MTRSLTRQEMLEKIRIYSKGEYSLMRECEDGVMRHRITPLFRVEFLGEGLEEVYADEIPQLKISNLD